MTCGLHDPGIKAPHALAAYDSDCPECGFEMEKGTEVIYLIAGEWVCEECASGVIDDPDDDADAWLIR